MKRIKDLDLGLVWSNKWIKKMLVGVIKVILVLLVILSAVLGSGKRPPFIPLLSIFFGLANFSTVRHSCHNRELC